MDTGIPEGHVGIVMGIDDNGDYVVKDANWNNDNTVRVHTVSANDPSIK